MMKSGSIQGVLDVLAKPHVSQGSLRINILSHISHLLYIHLKLVYHERGCGDLGPTGSTHSKADTVSQVVHDDGRTHGGQGPLASPGKVAGRGGHAIKVGHVGEGKVVHVVVHDDASARRHELASKTEKTTDIDR